MSASLYRAAEFLDDSVNARWSGRSLGANLTWVKRASQWKRGKEGLPERLK